MENNFIINKERILQKYENFTTKISERLTEKNNYYIYIEAMNSYLGKNNIFEVRQELLKNYDRKDKLSLYQLKGLLEDFKNFDKFILSCTCKSNYNIINKMLKENRIKRKKLIYLIYNKIKSL